MLKGWDATDSGQGRVSMTELFGKRCPRGWDRLLRDTRSSTHEMHFLSIEIGSKAGAEADGTTSLYHRWLPSGGLNMQWCSDYVSLVLALSPWPVSASRGQHMFVLPRWLCGLILPCALVSDSDRTSPQAFRAVDLDCGFCSLLSKASSFRSIGRSLTPAHGPCSRETLYKYLQSKLV